jgi:DNA-binding transcriptional LysR family regulator
MDRLFEIRAFVAAARFESLKKAAENLGVSISSISRALTSHEHSMKMRLLHRTTRVVTLNESARMYFQSCVQALDLIDEATLRAACEKNGRGGELRVAVHPMIVPGMLPRIVSRYRAMAPDVSLVVQMVEHPVNLADGRFDICLLPSELVDQGSVYRRLLRVTERVFVATPAYLAAAAPIRRAGDLQQHVLLLGSDLHDGGKRSIDAMDEDVRVELTIHSRIAGSETALRDGALADMGIAWVSEDVVVEDLAAGNLQRVLPRCKLNGARIELCLFYLDRQFMSHRSRLFMDVCTSLFKEASSRDSASDGRSGQVTIA